MTIREGSPTNPHPEGLTLSQEILADMLFETKQVAPVKRRLGTAEGYRFETIERLTSPIDFPQDEGEFAIKMHENQPDDPLSSIYVNLRNLPENVLDQVGVALSEIPTDEPVDFCAGIPKAGIPLAQAYSRHSGVPVIDILGKEETEKGRKIVAGEVTDTAGINVRLIDDLATGGETKLEAIKAAEEMGFKVVDILVLVDRQQGATEQLREAGYNLKAAFTLDQLLRYGRRTGKINNSQYNEVKEYLSHQAL